MCIVPYLSRARVRTQREGRDGHPPDTLMINTFASSGEQKNKDVGYSGDFEYKRSNCAPRGWSPIGLFHSDFPPILSNLPISAS